MTVLDPALNVCAESASSSECKLADVAFNKSSSLHTKVMQVEYSIGVLTHDKTKGLEGEYNFIFGQLAAPLKAVQSTNGVCTYQCLKDTMDSIPGLVGFASCEDFKFLLRHSCTDSYRANFVAERLLSQDMPGWVSLHSVCDIHRVYTCTKTSMATVDFDVSGLLNTALALNDAGVVSKLHQILAKIFGQRLKIVYETPPEQGSLAHTYRRDVLDMFLPVDSVDSARARTNKRRRHILEYFLNGHWYQDEIIHWCSWGCCESHIETLERMTSYVTWALIPTKCHKFPRARWTEWDKSIDWAGLLAACHNLLEAVVTTYIGKPQTGFPDPALVAASDADSGGDDDWETQFKKASETENRVPLQDWGALYTLQAPCKL